MRRFKKDRRAASNVIVFALGIVIVVIIVVNVFLWNYEMNQLDWERMKEDIKITDVSRITNSSWSVAQSEFVVNKGAITGGTYENTRIAEDGLWESFRERQPPTELDFNGTFVIELSDYPLSHIQTIEIQLKFRAGDSGENWYITAYNWKTQSYSDSGFNSTTGYTPTTGWDSYAVNLTDQWGSYLREEGVMYVKIRDQGPDPPRDRTTIDVDFLGVRVLIDGASFTFKNGGSLTVHLVSLWMNNSTHHRRYDTSIFLNAGDTAAYIRGDIGIPDKPYIVKIVTERGNVEIFSDEV
jgi:hypothetical protein